MTLPPEFFNEVGSKGLPRVLFGNTSHSIERIFTYATRFPIPINCINPLMGII